MRPLIHLAAVLALPIVGFTSAMAAEITGAGATFPFPVYEKWAESYNKASGNVLNYQSIGSSAGIRQIKAKSVDFGASDMPLSVAELKESGLMQFPAVMGGVVPVANIDGVQPGQLRLTGEVLGDIYLGKIKKWNAPAIALLNPELKLPASDITVAYRADGSGTSFLFSHYLSRVNADFNTSIGAGALVKWPVGVGGKGNEGVAANVKRISGAIGYVEYAYAKKNRMQYALLKNRYGRYVEPSEESFRSAASGADWTGTPGFALVLTDQKGSASWPITGASFILMHKLASDPERSKEALKFFSWAYKNGGAIASDLDYVSIPPSLIKLVEDSWKEQLRDGAGKAIW
jgi:phosphate transport system substrate-binding protein